MMQFLLFIALVCICVVVYRLNGRDPLSPAFLFAAGFCLCAFATVLFSDMWKYQMSIDVFGIVVSGVLVFVLISCFFSLKGKKESHSISHTGERSHDWILPVNTGLLLAFVFFEAVTFIWSTIEIVNAYPADTIPGSIGIYNSVTKFTDEGANVFHTPLSQMRSITDMLGYVFAFYLAQSFVLKKDQGRVLQLCGFLLACGFQLGSASRTAAAGYIVCFVISYFILKRKLVPDHAIINMRNVLFFIGFAVVFVISFQPIAEIVQGRTTSTNSFSYFSAYIGAQIPNLDTFIHSGDGREGPDLFGYMTFRNSIRWIGLQFGIGDFVYQYDLPFNTVNGVSTGNVYTSFYAFLYDFGFTGCIVLTAVMAAVSQLIYLKSKKLDSGAYSGIWVIVYTMVAYALILCFFSNKFYENIFTFGMIYKVIYLFIIFFAIKFFSSRQEDKVCRKSIQSWLASKRTSCIRQDTSF